MSPRAWNVHESDKTWRITMMQRSVGNGDTRLPASGFPVMGLSQCSSDCFFACARELHFIHQI